MSAVQLDDATRAGHALLKLDALGGPDAIADHLLQRGCFGDHHCDTCPVARYLKAVTGLDVKVTPLGWQIAGHPTTFGWLLPQHVEEFIAAHDRGDYPDLTGEGVTA